MTLPVGLPQLSVADALQWSQHEIKLAVASTEARPIRVAQSLRMFVERQEYSSVTVRDRARISCKGASYVSA